MKFLLYLFLPTLLFCNQPKVLNTLTETESIDSIPIGNIDNEETPKKKKAHKYQTEFDYIKEFAKTNSYNQDIAIMIDFSIHSGKKRFFVVDLKKNIFTHKALVCHGSCKGDNDKYEATTFSNKAESHCSTLGMALIAERAYSTWGKNYKYWLDGLDENNKNLRSRVVVLHAWEGVSDEEIHPNGLAMSWGCPTVSLDMLDTLDAILKKEKKVLLYSFK